MPFRTIDLLMGTDFAVHFATVDAIACIYCRMVDAFEITPDDVPNGDRWFECRHCFRRFLVRSLAGRVPPSTTIH